MEKTKKAPTDYHWLKTDDGSFTLFSGRYQENCHSTAGALAETQFHYIEGCQISSLIQSLDHFTLLEIGLGTGLGLELTLKTLDELPYKPTKLISTEIDRELVEFLISDSPFEFFRYLKKDGEHFSGTDKNGREIIILVGDARITVPHYFKETNDKVDAIYQDAFSPRKNPDLWTVEWFKDLKNISTPEVKLSTYSSSSSVRKSMIEAGWKVQKGPSFGTKRASTRATLQGESGQEVLDHLSRSPVLAITDATANEFKLGNPKI
jgi:tRNA U34 5-methylaminomethyl-2-thiouridine-forming methyltransferase MnmC